MANIDKPDRIPKYLDRVMRNEHVKRGLATGAVSILVGCVLEFWTAREC